MRNSFSFTFNSVTSCDKGKGKIIVYCSSFNLLQLSSSGFTKAKANKASFLRLNQQTRQHRFEGSVGLIKLILTCFNLSNTYLGFKNYHITRTFLLPAATAVY